MKSTQRYGGITTGKYLNALCARQCVCNKWKNLHAALHFCRARILYAIYTARQHMHSHTHICVFDMCEANAFFFAAAAALQRRVPCF